MDPFSIGLQVFSTIIGLIQGQDAVIRRLFQKIQRYNTIFRGMASRGLFGSQTQRRMVQSREIWEEIGWAEPAEVPHLFKLIPEGTTFTVKDEWPPTSHSGDWITSRGFRKKQVVYRDPGPAGVSRGLRWPDFSWFGMQFFAPSGFPPDALPGVGSLGVHRVDYPPGELQRAMDTQPQQYLGPRPLAGEEAELRRRAFKAGGGDVTSLWLQTLEEQGEREGRRVRTWTGDGWLTWDPNKELFDSKYSTAFHSGNPEVPGAVEIPGALGGLKFGRVVFVAGQAAIDIGPTPDLSPRVVGRRRFGAPQDTSFNLRETLLGDFDGRLAALGRTRDRPITALPAPSGAV